MEDISVMQRIGGGLSRAGTLCGLGVLWLCTRLPVGAQLAAGRALGRFAHFVYPYRKTVALINLELCFPDMPEGERRALVRRHFEAMGMGLFEVGMAWWAPDRKFEGHYRIEGIEHLRRLRREGRGALLLTAHFTTLEIVGRLVNREHRFSCLYRNPNDPMIAKHMSRSRERLMERIIHFDDMVGLIRALKAGDHVWYAPDQGKRFKYTAVLPFFGEPAVTNTATSRIAKMAGAAIVPFFGRRESDGTYTVTVHAPLEDIPGKSPEADARAINEWIESFIRSAPEQYFWLHKRFKNRGPDHPDPYAVKPS